MAAVAGSGRRRQRQRGSIEDLPSGALRVTVYGGSDPLTGQRHRLREVIPPGPTAAADAERARTRLLNQVDEKRNPRTRATVNQLLDRYLDVLDVEDSTRSGYEGYIRRHIRPVLGELQVGRLDAEILDSFYAQLRKCRARCRGRVKIDHRTEREHRCDDRCHPHECRPLAASTVRQIHWILSGALDRAVKWRWIAVNPAAAADLPAPPPPKPQPPSVADAVRIVTEAWKDPDWGTFLWLAMTTGARRGELCGLRRNYLDLLGGVLTVPTSLRGTREAMHEKDTKTHQQRRIALDPDTLVILREHIARVDQRAQLLGITIPDDAFLFSLDPDCRTPLVPDSVSQRYDRLVGRLGITTTLHKLRHYNATELIAGGADVRTVAGRLGHGGGGTTTLRIYAAWVSEADQRAAPTIAAKLPRPAPTPESDS